MPAPPSGGSAAAKAAPTSPAPPAGGADWFQSEPALGPTAGTATARLVRRARGSWRTWVSAAVLFAAFVTVQRARTPPSYEVTVVMHVVEGAVEGPALTEGEIVAQVNDLAFTNLRLLGVMRRHPASFPRAATDQPLALDDFRDAMKVEVSEDDFIEDRQPTDPRRSARITLSYKSSDPELAWTVAHDLQTLLVESGLQQQHDRASSAQEAAAQVVREAELEVSLALQDAGGGRTKRLDLAQGRLSAARAELADATVSTTATTARLALRFDVIDPGRHPAVPDRRAVLGTAFATSLFLGLLAFSALAGAYDPRVLDVDDLAALNAPVLGRFPALGKARDAHVGPEPQ